MTAVMPDIGHAIAPAAYAEPALAVYAKLPLLSAAEHEAPRWVWVEFFSVPVIKFAIIDRIASGTPWRWILFACGVILGTTRGTLSTSEAPDGHFDYDVSSIQLPAVYFHVPEDERPNLNSVEPGLCSNKTSSVAGPKPEKYREEVLARDSQCICSGEPAQFCDAAHLIPRLKGDEYIEILTNRNITAIDDVRNIVLLQGTLHKGFGKMFAIMPKPNFAYPDPQGSPPSWEPHIFYPSSIALYPACTVPANRGTWPPDLLFNQVYAAAVLHTFACAQATREALRKLSRRYYGVRGPMTSAERAKCEAAEKKRDTQTAERDPGIQHRGDRDTQEIKEIEERLPLWSVLLPDEMRQAWCSRLPHDREAADRAATIARMDQDRAASKARVTEWLHS